MEVLPQLTVLLALGVAVFAFDFAGSGKSDGSHVTLGYYEREDLLCVVAHLRATDVVSTIALWGRSMGAGGFSLQQSRFQEVDDDDDDDTIYLLAHCSLMTFISLA